MVNLRVTWQDGSWKPGGDQPIAWADIPAKATVLSVGDDTLAFLTRKADPNNGGICLVIPARRLISAVLVEVAE